MKSLTALLLLFFVTTAGPLIFKPSAALLQEKKQDERDQLRLRTDLIQLRAVVTDKRGQPIGNLNKDDFEVLEDNHPQTISFFSTENVGESPGSNAADSKTPVTAPNSLRVPLKDIGRTIVLLVDTVHISFDTIERTRVALRRFVDEQMTDRDMVAIITTSGAAGLMEQFTRSKQLLRSAINRLRPWRITLEETLFTPYLAAQIARGDRRSLFLGIEIVRTEEMMPREIADAIMETRVRNRATQVLAEATYHRRITLTTLKGVVGQVSSMPGQRLIAVFSEGFSLNNSSGGYETSDLQPAITRAVHSGVVIYTIATQGLKPMMVTASQSGIVAGRRRQDPGRTEMADLVTTMSASERDLQLGLNDLAQNTGGESFFNTNDLTGRLQKALNDNRAYYSLAYHTEISTQKGTGGTNSKDKFHSIIVRIKNHPEYKVRTQRGYQDLESKADPQPASPRQRLAQAMADPLPVTTIPVAVSADYFERENLPGQAYIQYYIDAGAFQYREQDKHYLFDVETVTMIYDRSGKRVHLSTKQANGSFTAERLEVAKRNGYRYSERVTLAPGVYQARVGVLELATERFGTATTWLEVPDLTKNKLTLSALLLTRDLNKPPGKGASMESMSPAVTQGITVYKQGDDLDYHLVIHPGKNESGKDLLMQIEVAQNDKPIYEGKWGSIESHAVEKDLKGIEVGGSLTLKGLSPGVYELRISVKTPNSKKPIQRVSAFGLEQ
jgi:VWFA-related protein